MTLIPVTLISSGIDAVREALSIVDSLSTSTSLDDGFLSAQDGSSEVTKPSNTNDTSNDATAPTSAQCESAGSGSGGRVERMVLLKLLGDLASFAHYLGPRDPHEAVYACTKGVANQASVTWRSAPLTSELEREEVRDRERVLSYDTLNALLRAGQDAYTELLAYAQLKALPIDSTPTALPPTASSPTTPSIASCSYDLGANLFYQGTPSLPLSLSLSLSLSLLLSLSHRLSTSVGNSFQTKSSRVVHGRTLHGRFKFAYASKHCRLIYVSLFLSAAF